MMKYVVLALIICAIALMAYGMGSRSQSPQGTAYATKDSTVRDVLALDDTMADLLAKHGMPCTGCPSAVSETVEQACTVHNLNTEEILHAINSFMENKEKNTSGN